MKRAAAWAAALAALAASAGCGSKSSSSSSAPATTTTPRPATHPVVERFYGKGADSVWTFARKGEDPKAVVIFLHGLGDAAESTPVNHIPFLNHLAARGDAVVYPRFESTPGSPRALLHALKGTLAGMRALNPESTVPVVVIGYSRGGGLAVDVAALAPSIQIAPAAVLSIFPAMLDPPFDYRSIPATTPVTFLVGDRDKNVSHLGRDDIVHFFKRSHHPLTHVRTEVIRSTPDFTADHLSFLTTSAGAKAAFWNRADRIVDRAVASH